MSNIIHGWVNIYPDGVVGFFHDTMEEANRFAEPDRLECRKAYRDLDKVEYAEWAINPKGWTLSNNSLDAPQIQRIDEQGIFASDQEALIYVIKQAAGGDIKALEALNKVNEGRF